MLKTVFAKMFTKPGHSPLSRQSISELLEEIEHIDGLCSFDDFLEAFTSQDGFTYTKINHAFWEALADVYQRCGDPVPQNMWATADKIAHRKSFFETGFVPDLLGELENPELKDDPSFHIGLSLSAWPGDDRIIGTPHHPERAGPTIKKFTDLYPKRADGLLLKKAIMNGRIHEFFALLPQYSVLIVGPDYIKSLCSLNGMGHAETLAIHPSLARDQRGEVEAEIESWIENQSKPPVVLMQAGTLAPYWILRMRSRYPKVKWVDGGLALSIGTPADILKRPWGQVYRRDIIKTYNVLTKGAPLPDTSVLHHVHENVQQATDNFPTENLVEEDGKISFVARKDIDFGSIQTFLEGAEKFNRWANRGPAWHALSHAYETHFTQLKNKRVIPCANGGIALEALANLCSIKAGRPLRWCVSAFGFANTGRGVFADAIKVDCAPNGVLSVGALKQIDPDLYDGIVVTNPFGLLTDFSEFVAWQKQSGLPMIIDNAAGVSSDIPDLPNQAFSLHQTKPYGLGEGGLAVVDAEDFEPLLKLMEYSPVSEIDAQFWVNNGKLSELSAAALLSHLETQPTWSPLYEMQAGRITSLARSVGLVPLLGGKTPTMNRPFLFTEPISVDALHNDKFVIGKYYKPLSNTPNAQHIFERIINIPTHPDMRHLDRSEILDVLDNVLKSAGKT